MHIRQLRISLLAGPVAAAILCTAGCSRDPNVKKQKYLQSGKHYEEDGKYKEAVIQLANAIKIDRNFSDAHYELAKTYLKMGTPMAGYTELMRTVDLSPNNIQARIDLGSLMLAGGAPDRAVDQAKAVLALDSRNADAHALLSSIAARKGDHAQALAEIQQALAIKPDQASYHTTLALIQGAEPQGLPGAEQELQKALSLDANNTTAHLVLASLLEKKGDIQGAELQYLAAIRTAPKNLQARGALTGLYLRAGNKAKAEQTARQGTQELSDTPEGARLLFDYDVRTGSIEAAEAAYKDLVDKEPKNVPLKIVYTQILQARGDFSKAAPLVEELNKVNGGNPEVELLNANLMLNTGKSAEAFDFLQKSIKGSPDNVPLQLAMGRVALAKGDLKAAEPSFRQVAQIEPANLTAQAGLAEIAIRRNDGGLLSQIAERTIAMRPEFADAYLWRGIAEAGQKQYDKADADFQTVLKKNPNSPAAYLRLGQLRLAQGRSADGAAMLQQALDRDPASSPALNMLVAYDLSQKQPAKAVARVQQQIAKVPANEPFYVELAGLQLGTHDAAGARDNAAKAMQMNSEDERAVQAYTQAQTMLGSKDDAIQTWEKWIAKHPKDAGALFTAGLIEESKGDQAKAMEYYKKTLQIDPEQALAANNLAYLMIENNQSADVALTLAQTARRGLPDSPNTADTLAWVYYHKGTYLSARDLLEEAVKKTPDSASLHYHLGLTYSKLGNKSDAETHLKKAAALEPDTQTGKNAAAALSQLG